MKSRPSDQNWILHHRSILRTHGKYREQQTRLATVYWLLVIFLISSVSAQNTPPRAPIRNVTDEYFGVKVVDPYRWMENVRAPETVDWTKAQAEYARGVLERLPLRNEILQKLNNLSDA